MSDRPRQQTQNLILVPKQDLEQILEEIQRMMEFLDDLSRERVHLNILKMRVERALDYKDRG